MRFGLIGDPIAHSLSPRLFKTAYGGKYAYELIEGACFEESFRRFKEGFQAINVTAPFKETAYEKADVISGPAALTGAANILVKSEDGIACHNSDFTGVILCISEELFPGITEEFYGTFGPNAHIKIHQFTRERLKEPGHAPKALVVGCGGAGKAAAVAAAELGCSTVVMNRDAAKAERFIRALPEYRFETAALEDCRECLREADIVIYTLPAAMGFIAELETADFKRGQIILEANYRDPSFGAEPIAKMQDAGARYIGGRRWLVHQAISGYALMTGEVPDVKALLEWT